jgi:serine/threonine protein kinase
MVSTGDAAMADSLQHQLQQALGDRYALERELAPGGMSRLFLATEAALQRQVVVKLLPPDAASEVSAERFRREMLVTARLQHPHILPVLDAGARDVLLYYVMPYVQVESLRARLQREGRCLSQRRRAFCASSLARSNARMASASCTGTSSQRTCCSNISTPCSPTSAWRAY